MTNQRRARGLAGAYLSQAASDKLEQAPASTGARTTPPPGSEQMAPPLQVAAGNDTQQVISSSSAGFATRIAAGAGDKQGLGPQLEGGAQLEVLLGQQQQQGQQQQLLYGSQTTIYTSLGAEPEAVQATGADGNYSSAPLEQNMYSIVNVTREYPFDCALIMFGYIMPFVLIITLITNFLVIVVLSRRHMRTPTNIVLMTMAIVDIGTLASPSPWYLYIYTFGNYDKYLFPPATCYAHYVMTDVIPIFLHTSSIWLALLLASQRYIYVCHPTLARTWCTVPRVKRAIFTILLVAFLHQSTHFFDNIFKPTKIEHNNEIMDACRNEMATWVSEIGDYYYYLTYYTFRIFFVFIIPCVALLTLNILLFRALRRAEKKRTELLKTKFKLVGVDHSHSVSRAAASRRTNGGGGGGKKQASGGRNRAPQMANNVSGFEASSCAGAPTQQRPPDRRPTGLFGRARAPGGSGKCRPFKLEFSLSTAGDRRQRKQLAGREHRQPVVGSNGSEADEHSCPSISEIFAHPKKAGEPAGSTRECDEELGGCLEPRRPSSANKEGLEWNGELEWNGDELDEDGESSCAECAACALDKAHRRNSLTCRRCSANDATEATLGCDREDGQPRHAHRQPISQCSSIMGGATNTTTNEDDVSSLSNHPASSSLVDAAGQTGSGSVAGPARGCVPEHAMLDSNEHSDLDIVDEEHNLSIVSTNLESEERRLSQERKLSQERGQTRPNELEQGQARGGPGHQSAQDDSGLVKSSSSADSRLACGCLSAHSRALHRVRLLRKTKLAQGRCCRLELIRSSSGHQEAASESQDDRPRARAGRTSPPAITSTTHGTSEQTSTARLSQPHAGPAGGGGGQQLSSQGAGGNANANSIGSLLQVHSTATGDSSNRTNDSARRLCPFSGRNKSPSFASSTGRGSRATLMGSSANAGVPLAMGAGSSQVVASQSGRTMDSNRTTLMLIVVVTVFLVVEVPVAAVTITHVVVNSFDVFQGVDLNSTLNYIKLFTNFFIMISYSINFTIYCSMSKKFRETFRDLFYCGDSNERRRAKRMMYQTQQQPSQCVTATIYNQQLDHVAQHQPLCATGSAGLAVEQQRPPLDKSSSFVELGATNRRVGNGRGAESAEPEPPDQRLVQRDKPARELEEAPSRQAASLGLAAAGSARPAASEQRERVSTQLSSASTGSAVSSVSSFSSPTSPTRPDAPPWTAGRERGGAARPAGPNMKPAQYRYHAIKFESRTQNGQTHGPARD